MAVALAVMIGGGAAGLHAGLGGGRAATLAGPYRAQVLNVVDGDTIEVRVLIWLGQEVTTLVRLEGIDTPELRGQCADERTRAHAARQALAALLGDGGVELSGVQMDKFGGRVVAQVKGADGRDLAAALVAQGYARPYAGGRRQPWCG
ncbi:thermonuclease family protein [Zavarzinia sp. CC-PAN008]|uniref:thermonuclease family protein n=1 Tax=Zavarzinia sp. CC-PAN008 TaxID=3243332 RepID=UPI003F74410C